MIGSSSPQVSKGGRKHRSLKTRQKSVILKMSDRNSAYFLNYEEENERMQKAEDEQTKIDRFWGLDAQELGRQREVILLGNEEIYSKKCQEWHYMVYLLIVLNY